ncbi:MAG TPA: dihydrofolate reductase family protein [Solirubrobacteraceae bacterium]
MEFRQLLPEPDQVDVGALLAALDLAVAAGPERPYIVANFIASADGRATFRGKSGALGDPADRVLFHGLRQQVDAVFAGTRTLMIERYGRMIRDPEARLRRELRDRTPEPLAVVVSRSGEVPFDIPLFDEPEARVALFCCVPVDVSEATAQVDLVELDPGELTMTTVMRHLRSDFGIRSLLCEGGPTVFGSLLDERLVDELFLTLAPKLVGGGPSPTISNGPELMELQPMELVWALENDGALYLRYGLR